MIDHLLIQADIKKALAEDIGTGDVTAALLPDNLTMSAVILAREPLVLCGRPWVDAVFKTIDSSTEIEWFFKEGEAIKKPATLCRIEGKARALLTAERSALNFLQTLSATATATKAYVDALAGTTTQLLDTRKTLPGLRCAQKYAVLCGGGKNHRLGLFDAYLIKENHIKASGSITKAILKARDLEPSLFLEVEVETLIELEEALILKPNRILLDNFSLDNLRKAVQMNKPFNCALEASGGVNLATIRYIAETGVDFISVGDITKSIKAIDLSLLIEDE